MDDTEQVIKGHRRWLVLLVIVGLMLIYGIFRILYYSPGHGEAPINPRPQQTVQ